MERIERMERAISESKSASEQATARFVAECELKTARISAQSKKNTARALEKLEEGLDDSIGKVNKGYGKLDARLTQIIVLSGMLLIAVALSAHPDSLLGRFLAALHK